MSWKGIIIQYCLAWFIVWPSWAQTEREVKFEQLTTAHGLSHNQVNTFYQDRQGFIWLGTLSGLNRYDGYELKTFHHKPGDTSSIVGNTIQWMSQGPKGKIWVKTGDGISLYDPHTEEFSSSRGYMQLLRTNDVFVTNMLMDRQGNSWLAIDNRGLVVIQQNGEIVELTKNDNGKYSIASNRVTDMMLDADGDVWIVHEDAVAEVINSQTFQVTGTYGLPEGVFKAPKSLSLFVDKDKDLWFYSPNQPFGLFYLNPSTGNTMHLTSQLGSTVVRAIVQNESGQLWIGADHGGLTILDKSKWRTRQIINDPDQPKSLVSNNINSMFLDKKGVIWIGTVKSGANFYHKAANNFEHYKYNGGDPAYNDMSCFVEDRTGNLWVGTNGKGLLYYSPKRRAFIKPQGMNQADMPDVVVSMLFASDGTLWVGTYLQGLYKYDGQKIQRVKNNPRSGQFGIQHLGLI